MKRMVSTVFVIVLAALLSSCAMFGAGVDDINRALKGVPATMSTYDQFGHPIDRIEGKSFDVRRDETFDSTDAEGNSNKDSSVIKISLGDNIINHVGSTMILAEDGIIKVSDAPTEVELTNTEDGRPWLHYLRRQGTDLWQGKVRTIMIRSQNGTPIAVFAGNKVTTYSTDVPKSTWFQVDGKFLFIYRADYTVYDTALLD